MGYITVKGGLIGRDNWADRAENTSIIQQIAEFAGVSVPNIDETMEWYRRIAAEKAEFRYEDYGIADRGTFEEFYLR